MGQACLFFRFRGAAQIAALATVLVSTSVVDSAADSLDFHVAGCRLAMTFKDRDGITAAAEQIRTFRHVTDVSARAWALRCLNSASVERWAYDPISGRFLTEDEMVAVRQAAAEEVARQRRNRLDRAERVRAMARDACAEMLVRDRAATLTNSVCIELLATDGVPD
jgi:hypothetical protein